jgi:pyruvate dehydrogenase E2 component (dihydrolipoamide acetyltransferase)
MADVREFRMPSLGADMTEGTLLEWLVSPGATVHKGDIVAVVDTSKAAIDVECFATGVIEEILVPPGTRVAVGTVLATIAAAAGTEPPPPVAVEPLTVEPLTVEPVTVEPAPVSTGASRVTSPLVRHLAAARHVDLDAVGGTGVGGRITRRDVEQAASRPASRRVSPYARRLAAELGVQAADLVGTGPGGTVRAEDVRRSTVQTVPAPDRAAQMRATIAALMARSKREIPHYYVAETIDLGAATDWMRDRNRELPVRERIVVAALLLKAAALAAAAVPELNGFWVDDRFVPARAVHLGVAVSLRGGGLVAPAIHDATELDVVTLMARMRDLVARTRAGRLRGSEMSDPTITVSNMGEQGAESTFGVIYPPQVALVGFGRIVERPWAVDGLIGVRPVVTASLAADHRATDGATGARYLQALARLLQRPEEL